MRFLQFLPWLESAGIKCAVSPLFDDSALLSKYHRGGYGLLILLMAYWRRIRALVKHQQFDLVWIEKEALPWWPVWFENWLLRSVPYVLDFDDAIFHNYDLHRFAWVRRIYGRRIDCLMAGARLVMVGNHYLAARAKAAGAPWVEVIPTVIDLFRYPAKQEYAVKNKPCIVWIGSPSTSQYLRELALPLANLAQRIPITLRVIGGGDLVMPGVDIEVVPWTAGMEATNIAECDVGIMPLQNTPWEQGKCAYKLIQYMACGLPTVASPIGANMEVVRQGDTGLFADSSQAWVDALATLLTDEALRQRLGRAGRMRVVSKYTLQQIAPRLMRLLKKAVN